MTTTIKKVAVLGSGVMGSGIAAHVANAGLPVVLLDIVKPGEANRNALTEGAVEKQLKANPSGFSHKKNAKLVTCGNLEDSLDLLKDCDWIIEAVLEKLEVKQEVYRKINSVRKPGCIVSSNTSTLPIHALIEGFDDSFAKDFMIAHFFNPPRFMRLLEVVKGPKTSPESFKAVEQFADVHMGKGIVHCKDTPGFIANRIGVYWMMVALLDAMRLNVTPEQADAVMGRPVGIPKTGVFGLFDLIGIDLMPLIAKEMLSNLPENDAFRTLYNEPELVKKMIADGYTGRKGKGGFYRINKQGDKKTKEVIDLKTGEYAPQGKKVELASIDAAKKGLQALVSHPDIGGQYAWSVLSQTLHYAASLVPDISDDIVGIDDAMRMGYNWKYGPFEMIDMLGVDWFTAKLKAEGKSVPTMLEKAAGKTLYSKDGAFKTALSLAGAYEQIVLPEGSLMLIQTKMVKKPVMKNPSVSLWDIGDGVACLELTSKMNSIDMDILDMIEQVIPVVKKDFKGLVIGNDADNFSVGANLALMLMAANMAAWSQISDMVRKGQSSMMALKYAPFPVVASLAGMALGGGCELVLHSHAVQAHLESYPGLVEVGVGLIPGWGGCKETILRYVGNETGGGVMPMLSKAFEQIAMGMPASSAQVAIDMRIMRDSDKISMNRVRVLADAKANCLAMAQKYTPLQTQSVRLPGPTAKTAFLMAIDDLAAKGKVTEHDKVVGKALAYVISGGDTDITETVSEQQLLDLEHEAFLELIKTKGTLARIEHMLETGKPLRN